MTASSNSFLYEHCDVPPGMSLKAWRAKKQPRRNRLRAKRMNGRSRPVSQ
jgi:hypothetical protein